MATSTSGKKSRKTKTWWLPVSLNAGMNQCEKRMDCTERNPYETERLGVSQDPQSVTPANSSKHAVDRLCANGQWVRLISELSVALHSGEKFRTSVDESRAIQSAGAEINRPVGNWIQGGLKISSQKFPQIIMDLFAIQARLI